MELGYPSIDGSNLYVISTSPAVGSFIDASTPTKVEFKLNSGVKAGNPAYVQVTFKTAMAVAKDEVVEVTLPRYTGVSSSIEVDATSSSAVDWSATWDITTQVI